MNSKAQGNKIIQLLRSHLFWSITAVIMMVIIALIQFWDNRVERVIPVSIIKDASKKNNSESNKENIGFSLKSRTIPILQVGTYRRKKNEFQEFSGWRRTITGLNRGDKLLFQVHSLAKKHGLTSVLNKLNVTEEQVFESQENLEISAEISSDYSRVELGSIVVLFEQESKLRYEGYEWNKRILEDGFKSKWYELPNVQSGVTALEGDGVNIGSLDKQERSNLILYFIVE